MTIELKIDPRIQALIDPLTKDEYSALEDNIVQAGMVFDPILIYRGTIVDGHNRYKIAKDHEIEFTTQEVEIESGDHIEAWVIRHQLGRRNLDPMAKAAANGRLKALLKSRNPLAEVTAKDVAVAAGVEVNDANIRSIQRDVQAYDIYDDLPPRVKQRIRDGEYKATPSSLRELNSLPADIKENVIDVLTHGDPDTLESVGNVISSVKAHSKPKKLGGKGQDKDPEGLIEKSNSLYQGVEARANRIGERKMGRGLEMIELMKIVLEKVQRWIDSP